MATKILDHHGEEIQTCRVEYLHTRTTQLIAANHLQGHCRQQAAFGGKWLVVDPE